MEGPSGDNGAGAALEMRATAPAGHAEARKVVTVLFCDIDGSVGIAEQLDPEALRVLMQLYFAELSSILERHGATVEKFIGDAVVALFGIPTAHEDDALRAVRAAAEIRDRIASLNAELERDFDVTIRVQIGLDTGEVVVGGAGTLATGDTMNVAARLQQAAGPGEILMGTTTYALVRDAVKAGPLETYRVKGKEQPVGRRRLHRVFAGAPGIERRTDTPLVGRRGELRRLVSAFDRVVAGRSPAVVNVLGPAGIGKSRLVAALADEVAERARVVSGRCLSYGDGIAFWPLAEILRGLGGEPALAAIAERIEGGSAIARHVLALSDAGDSSPSEETFWAVRRVLETAALERPLVVVIEDVHWARPTLLDLLEYLVGWLHDAPVLLVCVARPELADIRAMWTQPRPNVETVTLEPLSRSETETLLEGLARGPALEPDVRARIVEAAEGNPLFVEQLAAMVADEASAATRVPPSIQALLAERLDRLAPDERAVLERAAVMGRTFWRAAVVDLSPEEERADVGRHLLALVRRELLRPGVSTVPRLDAFEFRHALIRDAAYDGMPRAARARLHERFAGWIGSSLSGREEQVEEIVGYHLEQAFRHRVALAPMTESVRGLGKRAGLTLASAGQRARGRGDADGAVALLARAVSLLGPEDPSTLPDLGLALSAAGRPDDAEAVLGDAVEAARAIGDRRLEAAADVARAHVQLLARGESEGVMPAFTRALPILEAAGDERGQAGAWQLVAISHFMRCELAAMDDALARAAAHARAGGLPGEQRKHMARRAMALALGPAPVEEAIETCRGLLRVVEAERLLLALVGGNIATLEAMRGNFGVARAELAASHAILLDFGNPVYEAGNAMYAGPVELLAGDPAAAVSALREAFDRLEATGERAALATVAAFLARALREQGDVDESWRFVEESKRVGARNDVFAVALRSGTEARLLAARGSSAEAERLAADAVARAHSGDALNLAANVLADQSAVLAATRADDAWREPAREALVLYERKGNTVSAAAVRSALTTPRR